MRTLAVVDANVTEAIREGFRIAFGKVRNANAKPAAVAASYPRATGLAKRSQRSLRNVLDRTSLIGRNEIPRGRIAKGK